MPNQRAALLVRLIQQNKSAKADEARQFLEEIRGKIPRFLKEGETGVGDATLDAWREKVAEFIVALEGEAERNRGADSDHRAGPLQQP